MLSNLKCSWIGGNISFLLSAVSCCAIIASWMILKFQTPLSETDYILKISNFLSEDPIRDIHFEIPIFITSYDKFKFLDLAEATQVQLDYKLGQLDLNFQGYRFSLINNPYIEEIGDYQYAKSIRENQLYEIRLFLGESDAIYTDPFQNFAVLYHTMETINSNDLPYFITQLIINSFFSDELSFFQKGNLAGTKDLETYFAMGKSSVDSKVNVNFIILSEKKVVGVETKAHEVLESYMNTINCIYDKILHFDFSLEVQRTHTYAIDRSDVWDYDQESHVISLNDDVTYVDIRDDFYQEDPITLNDFSNFNFLFPIPGDSNLKVHPLSNSSIFKSSSTKSLFFINHVPEDSNIDNEYFVGIDQFNNVLGIALLNLYLSLSLPDPGYQTLRLDLLTRITIIKSLYKFSGYMRQISEILRLDGKNVRAVLSTEKIIYLLELRNEAVRLASDNATISLEGFTNALNRILLANMEAKKIIDVLLNHH
ncbi:hypothetical protein DASC09_010050 [Saccharomycopsis crataegensis]|uniref:Uncharacterized protein n=1 Tax=Saccharomycopsis crataegensis TaxID=43959 RepID=A0AAV5QH25_9ASCO|nr:hypothetical protein DASC09_010050 [Saccharomycopsis crataegensis]